MHRTRVAKLAAGCTACFLASHRELYSHSSWPLCVADCRARRSASNDESTASACHLQWQPLFAASLAQPSTGIAAQLGTPLSLVLHWKSPNSHQCSAGTQWMQRHQIGLDWGMCTLLAHPQCAHNLARLLWREGVVHLVLSRVVNGSASLE